MGQLPQAILSSRLGRRRCLCRSRCALTSRRCLLLLALQQRLQRCCRRKCCLSLRLHQAQTLLSGVVQQCFSRLLRPLGCRARGLGGLLLGRQRGSCLVILPFHCLLLRSLQLCNPSSESCTIGDRLLPLLLGAALLLSQRGQQARQARSGGLPPRLNGSHAPCTAGPCCSTGRRGRLPFCCRRWRGQGQLFRWAELWGGDGLVAVRLNSPYCPPAVHHCREVEGTGTLVRDAARRRGKAHTGGHALVPSQAPLPETTAASLACCHPSTHSCCAENRFRCCPAAAALAPPRPQPAAPNEYQVAARAAGWR